MSMSSSSLSVLMSSHLITKRAMMTTTTTSSSESSSSSSSRKLVGAHQRRRKFSSSSSSSSSRQKRTTTTASSSIRTHSVHAAKQEINLQKVIENLCEGKDLSENEAFEAMEALLDASENQIAAFLVLLRAKGETSSEMAGLARAMQSRAVQVNAGDDVLISLVPVGILRGR